MPQQSGAKFSLLVVLILVLAVVSTVSYLGWRESIPGPRVTSAPPRFLGHKTDLRLTVEAARGQVARVEVRVAQGGKPTVVATQEGTLGRRAEMTVPVDAAAAGLREGPATLEIWGRDDFWRPIRLQQRVSATFPVTIDLTPPKIEILGATRYISNGGAALVAFRVTDAAESKVSVGALTFPSFAMGPPDRGARVALVALPYDYVPGTPLAVSARDEAGNVATRGIPGELRPRRFPHDTIRLTDSMLQTKVPELLPQRSPSQPLLDGFLVINRDQRRQAEQEKRRIAIKTADHPLWEGPFVQPRNTKVFSNFAETRTYLYNGREVDTQVHYGYDLASTKQSPVPAANKGVVVFTGPLTIYGNAVVLDHGWGLMTLYGHLSSIDVKVGDAVDKGAELGRTGSTGLALGDHLHYEVLVNGISVTPLEWWDAKWIRDRVNEPLKVAGLPEIAGTERASSGGDDEAAPPVRRRARRPR